MNRTLIIAEAGVNHNGDIRIAKELIVTAKKCGADIVKFQTFNPSKLTSKSAKMAEYQQVNLGRIDTQFNMLSKLALKHSDFIELASYCNRIGITFLSTPFDLESIELLDKLQNIWKIPSGEITNYPYLVKIANTKKDIILSTGMSTLEEVDAAIDVLKQNGSGKITVLHCTTSYPTAMQDVNLNAMLTLKDHCQCQVGYSDHTLGIEVPIAAVAMGATVIEKHFTLDRSMEGPDHIASLEPDELKKMVNSIRNIEMAFGNAQKLLTESERNNSLVARKSIVAAKYIKKGELFSEKNITTKRPGNGLSPMLWNSVVGKKAEKDFCEDELIIL